MKTIRHSLLLCCSVLTLSCVDKVDVDINRGVNIAALEPMTDFSVPVKAGFTTIVTLDGVEIAKTQSPLTIAVPARTATRAEGEGVEWKYVSNEEIFDEFGHVSFWHYLAFEDTRKGDYDFNDVVLHCAVKSDVPWDYDGSQPCKHRVYMQPVALGSSAKVGFGFLYSDDAGNILEELVTDDIRRDLFNNDLSFPINTDKNKPTKKISNCLTKVFEYTTHESKFGVVWFVQNGNDRLYAATTNFDADRKFNMINSEGMPYGIALTQTWCWPLEKISIREAYPHFSEWLRSGDEKVLLRDRVRDNVYLNAVIKDGENGSLWDYPGGYVE